MKKIIVLLLITITIISCKKEKEDKDDGADAVKDLTLVFYLGNEGNRTATDTTVDGKYYQTFHWSVPQIEHLLDNTKLDLYEDGTLKYSGVSDQNGEYILTGLKEKTKYFMKFTSKTFEDVNGNVYHYGSDNFKLQPEYDFTYYTSSGGKITGKYFIALGNGIGVKSGPGSTSYVSQE